MGPRVKAVVFNDNVLVALALHNMSLTSLLHCTLLLALIALAPECYEARNFLHGANARPLLPVP